MKIAKIVIPLSLLPLIGMFVAVHYNSFEMPPEGSGYIGVIAYLAYLFVMWITYLPMLIFIPFGIALLICELCLFVTQGKFAALTAALVLMCILLLAVAVMAAYAYVVLYAFMWQTAVIMLACAEFYLAALVAMIVGYALECKKRRQLRKLKAAAQSV